MVEKDIDGYYIITNSEDILELKSRNKLKYYCLECNALCKISDYKPCKYFRYSTMLCRKCYFKRIYSNKSFEEKNTINEKRRLTNLKNLGVDNVSKSDKIKIKINNELKYKRKSMAFKSKNTWANKSFEEKSIINEKRRLTNLKNLGVDNNTQLKSNKVKVHETWSNKSPEEKAEIISKIESTASLNNGKYWRKKAGIKGWKKFTKEKIHDRSNKTRETKLKNHGLSGYNNLLKRNKTCNKKYKNPNYVGSEQWKSDMIKLYGSLSVKYKYFFFGSKFDSSWELAVWIYYIDHSIRIIRLPCSFKYLDIKGISHDYYPDFWIENIGYVEIKGDHFISDNGTFIDIFDNKDTNYDYKRICAIERGIHIWTENKCKYYLDYCKNKFDNSRWYRLFKANNPYNPSYINPNGIFTVCYPLIKMPIYYTPLCINNSITPYNKIDNDGYIILDNTSNNKGITPYDIGRKR